MRVTRCFAFLDLCGFSAYTEAHGDDQAVVVLAQLRTVLRTAAERRGVRLTKWLGDGAMLSGIDPTEVMACSLETSQRLAGDCPLPLRGGICEGKVIMFEGDDYVGGAVNAAARLCDLAQPGQLLTADLGDRVPAWAQLRTIDAFTMDPLATPLTIGELVLRPSSSGQVVVDPVCGLALDPESALLLHDLRFCSTGCAASWEPERAA